MVIPLFIIVVAAFILFLNFQDMLVMIILYEDISEINFVVAKS